jgi:DNA-binding MurR/RpiR family transcriptional regulator
MPATRTQNGAELPQDHYESLVNSITTEYPKLSERFQQVARYVTQNPNSVALESINSIAAKCGAHPSILVRFAQHFGYTGFKQLQAVFQTRLASTAPGYHERISALDRELHREREPGNLGFLRNLVVRDVATLQELLNSVSEDRLTQAAEYLKDAQTVYIAGQLRSEPIAVLLRYVLTMLHRRVVLLDPSGGLAPEMARTMTDGDVLVAISFRHYAKEVILISDIARESGTPVVAITDSELSPLAKNASVLFTIPEEEYSFSRSLAAPMCLAQSIAISLAALLQPDADAPRIATVTGNEHSRNRRSRHSAV